MKRIIILLCGLFVVLSYGAVFAAPASKVATTLNDIPPAWSRTLQCDTTVCPRFELVMGGAAVLDHETGLVWEQSPSTSDRTWEDAQIWCNTSTIGGRLGWRLPTIQELASLVDPTQSPPLPSGHPFSNVRTSVDSSYYWSATTYSGNPYTNMAWVVSFFFGTVIYDTKTSLDHAWCVRGGQGVDPQ